MPSSQGRVGPGARTPVCDPDCFAAQFASSSSSLSAVSGKWCNTAASVPCCGRDAMTVTTAPSRPPALQRRGCRRSGRPMTQLAKPPQMPPAARDIWRSPLTTICFTYRQGEHGNVRHSSPPRDGARREDSTSGVCPTRPHFFLRDLVCRVALSVAATIAAKLVLRSTRHIWACGVSGLDAPCIFSCRALSVPSQRIRATEHSRGGLKVITMLPQPRRNVNLIFAFP